MDKHTQIHHDLMRSALLHLQSGRYQDAVDAFLRVAQSASSPTAMRADALSNMAVCYLRVRDWKNAAGCAQAAVKLDATHVDAWFNLGGAQKALGNGLDAMHAFRRVCALRPERLDAWRYRAIVAQSIALWDEAIECWTTVFQKNGDPSAFAGRIECLVQSGRAPAAELETTAYMARNSEDVLARYLHALVLSNLQRFDEAWPLAQRLHGNPALDLLSAWVAIHAGKEVAKSMLEKLPESARKHILRLKTARADDLPGLVAQARSWLARPQADPADDLAGLHFQLGRIADDSQKYEAAWEHYTAAHRWLARVQPYHEDGRQALDAWLRQRPWEAVSPVDHGAPSWIFIVGMPRSGTSLLEQILDQHPAITGTGERHEMQAMAQALFADGNLDAVREACVAFARKGRDLAPDSRWIIDKMPHNFLYAGMLLHLFPGARVLWCRRDPLDTTVSIWRQHFRGVHPYAHDWEALQATYRWHETLMEAWCERYPGRIMEVRYESVVENLEGTITGVLGGLGEDWDPACERFFKNPRKILTASREQVTRPLYRDAVGSGKKYDVHVV